MTRTPRKPVCHPDRAHYGNSLCHDCYLAQKRADYAAKHGSGRADRRTRRSAAILAAFDALHADPDRPLGRCACIDIIAKAAGCNSNYVRLVLTAAGRVVVPRERRQVPCPKCGTLRTEAHTYDAPGAGLCGECRNVLYRKNKR